MLVRLSAAAPTTPQVKVAECEKPPFMELESSVRLSPSSVAVIRINVRVTSSLPGRVARECAVARVVRVGPIGDEAAVPSSPPFSSFAGSVAVVVMVNAPSRPCGSLS